MKNNNLVAVYINGVWESAEDTPDGSVNIYEVGTIVEIKRDLCEKFINDLEDSGEYDNYFCPEMYSHPNWNGRINYLTNQKEEVESEEESEKESEDNKKHIEHIINVLNFLEVDGETMEYIIEKTGMTNQMLRQLVLKADQNDTLLLLQEKKNI